MLCSHATVYLLSAQVVIERREGFKQQVEHVVAHSNNMNKISYRIGYGYITQRRPDPRIFSQIRQLLNGMSSLLDVGAGLGSYEPDDLEVIALTMAILTIHHWDDLKKGLENAPL